MSIKLKGIDLVPQKFLRIPYKLNGRSIKGIDCLGIILMWLENEGVHLENLREELPLDKDWWKRDPDKYIKGVLKYGDIVPLKMLKRNDIVVFCVAGNKRIANHAVVMVNSGWFLHVMEDGVSRVDCFNQFWRSRIGASMRLGEKVLLELNQEGFR